MAAQDGPASMAADTDTRPRTQLPTPLWGQAVPTALLTVGLAAVAFLLQLFGRPYLLVFTMNVSMVTFALTLVIYRRYRDWRILPLALLFFWNTGQQSITTAAEVLSLRCPEWVGWLMASPLVGPTVLGFAAVVFLWRVFEVQADLERREQRFAERLQQAQKLESLGIMAGGIAHDFGNLLTTVIGNAAIIQMDLPEDSDLAACARSIQVAAEKASMISRQMLDYSGCGKFRVERVTLKDLLDRSHALIESYVPARVELHFEAEEGGEARVDGDVSQLGQVVMNLVTNAVEAISRNGAIHIRTGTVIADEALLTDGVNIDPLSPGRYALLEVEDNGQGMDANTCKRMFDPFVSSRFVGRGMGLAAVLGIVRGHHGTVRVQSTLGSGTRVQVLLPASGENGIGPPPPGEQIIF